MIIVRLVLISALAIFCAGAAFMLIVEPSNEHGATAGILVLFVLIILGLGPLWPSREKTKRWKFDLPTDNPKVAAIGIHFSFAVFSFYEAWSTYVKLPYSWQRIERFIAALFGENAVPWFWIAMGLFFCWGGINAYRQFKAA